MTLLVIYPGKNTPYGDCCYNILVAETGEHLKYHICSSSNYAYGDLYTRAEKREEWEKRFGEIEVKFIDETDITEDQLIERNKKWAETQSPIKSSSL